MTPAQGQRPRPASVITSRSQRHGGKGLQGRCWNVRGAPEKEPETLGGFTGDSLPAASFLSVLYSPGSIAELG